MKITIVQGHHQPDSRNTQKGTMWSQKAYADLGGAFPAEIKISLQSPERAYAVGEYELSPQSFKVGQYGDLEVNRFNIKLVPSTSSVKPSLAVGK